MARYRFGIFAAKVDIEDRDIATVLLDQLKRFSNRGSWSDHAKTSIRQMYCDIDREESLVFDDEHTDIHETTNTMTGFAFMLPPRLFLPGRSVARPSLMVHK